MYRNEEVEDIKKKMLICGVAFVFVLLIGLLVVLNRFRFDEASVLKELQKKETFVVLIHNGNYEKCSEALNEMGISYYLFDVSSSSYDEVLTRLHITYDVKVPAIYVIEDGKVVFNITNVSDKKTVKEFIQNNNISALLEGDE